MKRVLSLLMALVMMLSLVACGGSEPAETTAATEAAVQVTEAPTEESTTLPTEDPNEYFLYELSETESYEEVVWQHGFWELDLGECVEDARANGEKGAQAIPLSLELSQHGFRMYVDYTGYSYVYNAVLPCGTVEIVGAKADGLADISRIDPKDHMYADNTTFQSEDGVVSDYMTTEHGVLIDEYSYFNFDSNGELCDLYIVEAYYYPLSGNLYNVVYVRPNLSQPVPQPSLLTRKTVFRSTTQTLTYGEFSYEMSQFAVQCGDEMYIYDYRPGMSFSDWACSELNTDGWIPWYGDSVLSPDRTYIIDLGYLDMRDHMDLYGWFGNGDMLVAEINDGSINRLNNNSTYVDIPDIESMDLGGLDLSNGGSVSMVSEDQLQEFMEQNGLNSLEEVQEYLQQNGAASLGGVNIQPDSTDGEVTSDDIVNAIASSEENEINLWGNISVSLAHMVNAKTPLFTPGFRIVSKMDGRVAYHSVEMGGGHYLLDDILDIYMNGIADELIPHIKLYAFPESEAFMATLEGHTILNVHTAPLEQGSSMLTIPENAVCLTFERVQDGHEAPNTPSPLRVPVSHNGMEHGSMNKDAVYARYVTKDDPNFGEGVNMVFAITFDDELVYWIHMGANFNETVEIEYQSRDMRY